MATPSNSQRSLIQDYGITHGPYGKGKSFGKGTGGPTRLRRNIPQNPVPNLTNPIARSCDTESLVSHLNRRKPTPILVQESPIRAINPATRVNYHRSASRDTQKIYSPGPPLVERPRAVSNNEEKFTRQEWKRIQMEEDSVKGWEKILTEYELEVGKIEEFRQKILVYQREWEKLRHIRSLVDQEKVAQERFMATYRDAYVQRINQEAELRAYHTILEYTQGHRKDEAQGFLQRVTHLIEKQKWQRNALEKANERFWEWLSNRRDKGAENLKRGWQSKRESRPTKRRRVHKSPDPFIFTPSQMP